MAGKLGKPCAEPRCPEIIPDRQKYCEKHAALYPTHNHNQRAQERLGFYHSKRWRQLRDLVVREQPICARCRVEATRVVHHIKQAREYPELRFVRSNLEGLCDRCHNRESQREKNDGRKSYGG